MTLGDLRGFDDRPVLGWDAAPLPVDCRLWIDTNGFRQLAAATKRFDQIGMRQHVSWDND